MSATAETAAADVVLETLRRWALPMRASELAQSAGLDVDDVDAALDELAARGLCARIPPCYWKAAK